MTGQIGIPGVADVGAREVSSDDWYTPRWVWDLAAAIVAPWGELWDPCPPRGVGGLESDGWETEEAIYCNPPYSDPGPWMWRCATAGVPAVALVKLDPSTRWWPESHHIGLIRGRIRFEGPHVSGPAPFPSALILWRCSPMGHPRVQWWSH